MQVQFLILNNVRKVFLFILCSKLKMSLSKCLFIQKCNFYLTLVYCHKKTFSVMFKSMFSIQCAIILFWIILAQYSNVQHTNYRCQMLFVLTSCDQVCWSKFEYAYLNKIQQWIILYNLVNNIWNSRQVV